jgi:hypothetical protein
VTLRGRHGYAKKEYSNPFQNRHPKQKGFPRCKKAKISSPDLGSYAAWGQSIQNDTQWGDAGRQGNRVRCYQADKGERESCKKNPHWFPIKRRTSIEAAIGKAMHVDLPPGEMPSNGARPTRASLTKTSFMRLSGHAAERVGPRIFATRHATAILQGLNANQLRFL